MYFRFSENLALDHSEVLKEREEELPGTSQQVIFQSALARTSENSS